MKQQRKSFQCTNAPMHRCADVPMCQLYTYQSHSDGDRVLFVLHVDVMLAAEALRIMEENEISSLVVFDDKGALTGVVHLKDLLHAGIA